MIKKHKAWVVKQIKKIPKYHNVFFKRRLWNNLKKNRFGKMCFDLIGVNSRKPFAAFA